MLTPERDLELMRQAFELSQISQAEDDRAPPKVGAVIVTLDGHVISTGYRGQHTAGHHAEQEALNEQRLDVLRGSIVYTTLEPCTVRGREASCCQRLIRAGVAEVVIGMLDPNRDIRGKGWWELEDAGIRVRYFAPEIVQQIRHLNREFISYQLGVGLLITAIEPEGCPGQVVTSDNRLGRSVLSVPVGKVMVRGTFRVKPVRGHRIQAFVRRNANYFPQPPIDFDFSRYESHWQSAVSIHPAWQDTDNEVIIASVSEDLKVAFAHYYTAHEAMLRKHGIDF